MTRISWRDLGTPQTDSADGAGVIVRGFPVSIGMSSAASRFLLTEEPACCAGCAPRDPLGAIAVFAASALPMQSGALTLAGTWSVACGGGAGPRYEIHGARCTEPPGWHGVTR